METVEPEALLALKPFAPEMLNDRDALAGIRCFDAPVYDLARQFRAADRIVVAAPFWDLTFPAALRTYIEYISANGLTYHYEADGCHGDCRAEKLAYLTSGGDLEQPGESGCPVLEAAVRHVRHPGVQLCVCRRTGPGSRQDGGDFDGGL